MLFIASLAIGGVAGTAIDIEGRFDRLTERLSKPKAGEGGKTNLSRGLSTGIVLFCFGTLSILGPINSALYGDETFLLTNATLDFVTSMVLASSFGIGMALAGVVLFCWQGSIFLLAQWLEPLMTANLMCEITIVGGFLILASGLSILKIKEISVMNLLPALLVPPSGLPSCRFCPLGELSLTSSISRLVPRGRCLKRLIPLCRTRFPQLFFPAYACKQNRRHKALNRGYAPS